MSNEAETVIKQRNDNQGLEPKLRFPEFRDAGEWNFKPLKALAKRKTKRNADESIVRVLTNSAEHGVIDQKDYFDKDIAVQGNLESYFIVALGDYVYNPRVSVTAPVGPIGKNKIGLGVMSPLYTVFGFNCEDEFYEHFFRSSLWHPYLRFVSNSGARHDRMAVSADDFMAMPVPAPVSAEQKKIAECLSSLDALIAAETDKLAALRDYKKGMMQQLFPAEGETTPRLRFPEFRDTGAWEETTIGEVGSFYYGKSAPKWSLEEDAPTPCIRYGELYTKFGPQITQAYSRTNIPPENLRFSKGGEILVPRVGEKPDEFGLNCCHLTLSGIAIGEMISVFETNQNALFYTFYFRHIYRDFSKVVEGQNVKNLYYAVLEPLTIFRPTLPEQKKIAECLMSFERVVEAAEERLDELKAHKSGLTQQLFPSPQEPAV